MLEQRSPERIFRPSSVAIVGATEGGWSQTIFDNLRLTGFAGNVYPLNPRRETLWGLPCYPSFSRVPEPVDVALTIVNAQAVPAILEEGRSHGLRSAVLYASGFKELENGAELLDRIAALSHGPDGLRITGPNSLGTLAIAEHALFYPHRGIRTLPGGNTGVLFSSGGSLHHWLRQGAIRGLGFSYAASTGDELDLDVADFVNFLIDDPHTSMICCLVEGIRRPEAFMAAAKRALDARKPIALVKIGRSLKAQQAAVSHTGALAIEDAVFDAVCERYGIVRAATLDDLLETALAFSGGRLALGHRVAVMTHSGGIKGLFLDEAEGSGISLAQFGQATLDRLGELEPSSPADNPYDAGATLAENSQRFGAVCETILGDPNIDVFAVQGLLPTSGPGQRPASFYAGLAAISSKPVIAFERMTYNLAADSRDFQRDATIPFLQGIAGTVRALTGLVRYSERARRGVSTLPAEAASSDEVCPADLEALIKSALMERGATLPMERFAEDEHAAASAAEDIGFPVALKLVSESILHKTEAGAVQLDLRDRAALVTAAAAMRARLQREHPAIVIRGFLVQEMIDGGAEMLLGARNDAQFGPMLMLGLGGITSELVSDVALRLLPVDEDDVRSMLAGLKSHAALGAFRGRPARDVPALTAASLAVADVFLRFRHHISDLEINPLIVNAAGDGVRAIDIRVVRRSE